MRYTITKHKHLTLSDRNDIQLGLERDETVKTIEQFILKDPTTVSKERKKTNETDKSESLAIIIFLSLYSMRLPLFVIGDLKEGKTVVIKNILLSNLVKALLSTLRLSGTWIKSFLMGVKRDNISILITLCQLLNRLSTYPINSERHQSRLFVCQQCQTCCFELKVSLWTLYLYLWKGDS